MKVKSKGSLHQIIFFPSIFPVNCYLVEEKSSLLLIDAALPKKADAILNVAAKIGKPITHIILTHAHGDHVGSLDELKERLPNARVAISERDARLLAGDKSLDPGEGTLPIKGDVPKGVKTRADLFIKEGDKIGSLRAVATPGHTPGSMSFLDERTNFLIVGDAFQTRSSIAVSGTLVPLFPFPAFATWNKEVALQSAKKIAALSPNLLAVGHGKMLSNPAHDIEKAIYKAEKERVKWQ
ncbi:MBL fold metallo-hydrolase [Radiobacillus kanasensis]|uniref:MBL fold metallo-hydrolase n=1 Tax=Radiobacillus kanasensis TaxID=2844358 RepID=UPI001E5C4F5E|nr:MBL fold metallo-hydrolase [Radiobacillus kanasensis]UFU00808.1 MBL fold metallo-hydrolase [Radiobacillus kanasensis]